MVTGSIFPEFKTPHAARNAINEIDDETEQHIQTHTHARTHTRKKHRTSNIEDNCGSLETKLNCS